MSGCASYDASADSDTVAQDIPILNTAIATEHEAVAAYQVGAESGLLETGVLDAALQFQGHHKEHIDALANAVVSLGGTAADKGFNYSSAMAKSGLR